MNDIDYKKIEAELKKIPCPICSLYPREIGLSTKITTISTCEHDEHITVLTKEFVRLKKEQRMGIKP